MVLACLFGALLQSVLPLHAAAMAVDTLRAAMGVCGLGDGPRGTGDPSGDQAACEGCVSSSAGGAPAPTAWAFRGAAAVPRPATPSERRGVGPDHGPPPSTGPPALLRLV